MTEAGTEFISVFMVPIVSQFKNCVVWEDFRLGKLGEDTSDSTTLVKEEFS